ncbi:hypothetical protein BJ166DRAFT_195376 [Pestalotiopsis sp. NC0098]|nr:hypothetical protein BJ166DRAFT_195376 [Pestalotiopsis sp. NC0098]
MISCLRVLIYCELLCILKVVPSAFVHLQITAGQGWFSGRSQVFGATEVVGKKYSSRQGGIASLSVHSDDERRASFTKTLTLTLEKNIRQLSFVSQVEKTISIQMTSVDKDPLFFPCLRMLRSI